MILASISVGRVGLGESRREAYRRALLLNPGDATGHDWYGEFLLFMGRTKEALSELRLASELDPLSPHIAMVLGSVLYSDRQYERAIEAERKVLELNPNSGIAYIHIALCHLVQRRFAEATVAFDRAGNLMPGAADWPSCVYRRADRKPSGGFERARQVDRRGKCRAVARLSISQSLYVGLGDKDGAFEALNRACDRRMPLIEELKVDPLFDPLEAIRDIPYCCGG